MHVYVKRCFLGILLGMFIIPTHAQKKGYYPGYIITQENETLEGWIKDRSTGTFIDLYKQIRFKSDRNSLRKKYGPDEILAYGYSDQHFESVPLEEESAFFKFRYYLREKNERVFLKLIAYDKDLSYFHWEYVDDESNYLNFIPLFYREGYNEMVRVTQGILGLKRKRLSEYFWDCPDLIKAIENKHLNEIDEVYNFYMEHCGSE